MMECINDVINNGRTDSQFNISQIEEKYNAHYVGQFCPKTKDGAWANMPMDVFWQANPNTEEGHTHYFGVYVRNGRAYITNGDSAVSGIFTGIVAKNGEIIYSRFRHDYRVSTDKSVFIDGGRDYFRSSPGKFITFKIDGPNFYMVGGTCLKYCAYIKFEKVVVKSESDTFCVIGTDSEDIIRNAMKYGTEPYFVSGMFVMNRNW